MNASDYVVATFRQGGTVSIGNTISAGNPGNALSVLFATPAPAPFTSDSSSNTLVSRTFLFDPVLLGSAYSISFAIDKSLAYSPSTFPGANGQGFLISQGGQLFLHAVALPNVQGIFQTASFISSLATDFSLFNPATGAVNAAVHPNFAAGAMQFGFTSSLFLPVGAPSVQAQAIYDNFAITIRPVPEPAAFVLMLAGLATLLAFRRASRVD